MPENKDPSGRYAEMRAISMLMKDRDFKAIPAQFRNMKRIWAGKPKKGGVTHPP